MVVRYTKNNATQEEFLKDRRECLQQEQKRLGAEYVKLYGDGAANNPYAPDCDAWTACLVARGYEVDPKGQLVAPPNLILQCRN